MRRGVGLTCSPQKIIPFNAGGQVHRFLTNVLGESRKTLLQRKFLFQPASSLDHRCTSDRRYRSMDRVCGKLEFALEQSKKRILLGLSLCKNSVAHVTQNETLKLFIADVIEGIEQQPLCIILRRVHQIAAKSLPRRSRSLPRNGATKLSIQFWASTGRIRSVSPLFASSKRSAATASSWGRRTQAELPSHAPRQRLAARPDDAMAFQRLARSAI